MRQPFFVFVCGMDSPGIGNTIHAFCRVVEDADPYDGDAHATAGALYCICRSISPLNFAMILFSNRLM